MPDITINGGDGDFSAYLAAPAGGSGPGILVIQEIFGVNADMRAHCDAFAAQGYFALSPDIFWRQEPGIQLTDKTEAEWQRAFELYQGFDVAKGMDDLLASLGHLRGIDGCSGKTGTVGYCLGGLLAYLMACQSDAECNVSYYGVGIDERLDQAPNITAPSTPRRKPANPRDAEGQRLEHPEVDYLTSQECRDAFQDRQGILRCVGCLAPE